MFPPYFYILSLSIFNCGLWSIDNSVIIFPFLLDRYALESPTLAIYALSSIIKQIIKQDLLNN